MSEQESGKVIDITEKLQEKRIAEGVAEKSKSGDFGQQEKSPSIAELVKRKITSVIRTVMPPKR